jgi:tRNA (mo5U34)-methyltransferase
VQGTLDRAKEIGWYHTMELAPGHVTEGMFDLRPVMDRYGLPERMDGMRALDVGTWDGFWAFEMERRGAEVVALDLDDERELDYPARRRPKTFSDEPRGRGFKIAHELYDSNVERVVCNIYDALPENLGTFDLVFCGSVLIHLRDQVLALERIAGLCRDKYLFAEEYDRKLNWLPIRSARYLANRDSDVVFWLPNVRTWKDMLWTAGFDRIEDRGRQTIEARAGWKVPHVFMTAYKS